MNRIFFALVTVLAVSQARATTLVIVTDEPTAVKAKEVLATFQNTPPFSRLESFDLKIRLTNKKTLGCQGDPVASPALLGETPDEALMRSESAERIAQRRSLEFANKPIPASCVNEKDKPTRLITCDTPQANKYLDAVKAKMNADFILVVLDLNRYGGSGGKYPVITSASPASMAVHELMHQLGFADEYQYISACEADTYCDLQAEDSKSKSGYGYLPGTSFNVAMFNPFNSYIDDQDVKNRHGSQIPWVSSVVAPLQVNGTLGTPAADGRTGLYGTNVCGLASRRLDTWQAQAASTIMKSLSTNYVPDVYWETIAKSLGTKVK